MCNTFLNVLHILNIDPTCKGSNKEHATCNVIKLRTHYMYEDQIKNAKRVKVAGTKSVMFYGYRD